MASASRSLSKLFVGNLPWTVGTRELKLYFSEFGQVASANVIFDRNTGFSRGYGFVVFSNSEGFQTAKEQQTHLLEGNNIVVKVSGQ